MNEEFNRAANILLNLEILLQENELLDYTVKVEDENFRCHRVILAASSYFFRGLFKSNMKEEKEGCVTLNEMSALTFKHILHAMYTGKVDLTQDNFIDTWKAVHHLQIDFMINDCERFAIQILSEENFKTTWEIAHQLQNQVIIQRCEEFALKVMSLDNFENIFQTAKKVNSINVIDECKRFMLKNFDGVSQLVTIMELPFNEFLSMIESQDLNVSSEDTVLKTVIKWIEYGPKERYPENAVTILLKSVRTCLVSTPQLKCFLKHKLMAENLECKDIIIDAVFYKSTHYKHGQWPTAAIHRFNSQLEHVGIVSLKNFILVCDCNGKFYKTETDDELSMDVSFVAFDSYVYATGVKDETKSNSSLLVFSNNSWNKIAEIPGRRLILVPFEQNIFILNKTEPEIYQIFPKDRQPKVKVFTNLPETIKVQQAINYQRMVLIFSSVTVNGEEKTAVHQLDILTKKLTELEQLDGPAEHIISFSDDNNTYLLQTCGQVSIIKCLDGNVTFESVCRLWTYHRQLQGAFTYKQRLIILGTNQEHEATDQNSQIKFYFSVTKYLTFNACCRLPCSNFIPVVLPKNKMVSIKQIAKQKNTGPTAK